MTFLPTQYYISFGNIIERLQKLEFLFINIYLKQFLSIID